MGVLTRRGKLGGVGRDPPRAAADVPVVQGLGRAVKEWLGDLVSGDQGGLAGEPKASEGSREVNGTEEVTRRWRWPNGRGV